MSATTHVLGVSQSVTVTSASAAILTQNMQRNFLMLQVATTAGSVWINPVSSGTATVQTAGMIRLDAGMLPLLMSEGVLTNAMSAVTSAGSVPLTVITG